MKWRFSVGEDLIKYVLESCDNMVTLRCRVGSQP